MDMMGTIVSSQKTAQCRDFIRVSAGEWSNGYDRDLQRLASGRPESQTDPMTNESSATALIFDPLILKLYVLRRPSYLFVRAPGSFHTADRVHGEGNGTGHGRSGLMRSGQLTHMIWIPEDCR